MFVFEANSLKSVQQKCISSPRKLDRWAWECLWILHSNGRNLVFVFLYFMSNHNSQSAISNLIDLNESIRIVRAPSVLCLP